MWNQDVQIFRMYKAAIRQVSPILGPVWLFSPWVSKVLPQGTRTHCCSVSKLCLTICNPMTCGTRGFPVLHYHLELAKTHTHWVSDAIQPSQPLSPPSLALSLPQHHGLFQWVGQSIGASVSVSVLPMNIQDWFPSKEHPGLISFRMDWFDILAVQETLESLLQHHSAKASILWHSAFFYDPTLTSIHDYWKNQ